MKKTIITITLAIITSILALASTPDSMYVHFTGANGDSIVVHAIVDIDSIVYYAPAVPQGIDWSSVAERVVQENALTDADGNSYSAVKIGTQVWMAENLRATQYTDGTAIPNVDNRTQNGSGANNAAWADLGDNDTDKAYCWYNNDSTTNAAIYGALYTYAAASNGTVFNNTNVQGVCPTGWHLPSDAEFKTLEIALGMSQSDADDTNWRGTAEGSELGGNLDLWVNDELTDSPLFGSSGFLALPAGSRSFSNGGFGAIGLSSTWWCSNESVSTYAYIRSINWDVTTILRHVDFKSRGFSVRCVRDNEL